MLNSRSAQADPSRPPAMIRAIDDAGHPLLTRQALERTADQLDQAKLHVADHINFTNLLDERFSMSAKVGRRIETMSGMESFEWVPGVLSSRLSGSSDIVLLYYRVDRWQARDMPAKSPISGTNRIKHSCWHPSRGCSAQMKEG